MPAATTAIIFEILSVGLVHLDLATSLDHGLEGKLKTCLGLVTFFLRSSPPRTITSGHNAPPMLLYTDASDVPQRQARRWLLGAVLIYGASRQHMEFTSWAVPESVVSAWTSRATFLGQLEILAGPLALATWPGVLRHGQVSHFGDNDAAAACLVKGYSPRLDSSPQLLA